MRHDNGKLYLKRWTSHICSSYHRPLCANNSKPDIMSDDLSKTLPGSSPSICLALMWTRHDCLFPGSDNVWETLLSLMHAVSCCETIKHPGSPATFVWSNVLAHRGLIMGFEHRGTKPPEVMCCFFSRSNLNVMLRGIIRDEVKQGNQSLKQGCHMSITSCLFSQYWVSLYYTMLVLCYKPLF